MPSNLALNFALGRTVNYQESQYSMLLQLFLSISHPVSNAGDEVLYVKLGGAALLARGVGTLEAASGLP
jgi:hypothetical protein